MMFDVLVGYGKFNFKEGDLYVVIGLSDWLVVDIVVYYEDCDGWGCNMMLNWDVFIVNSIGV